MLISSTGVAVTSREPRDTLARRRGPHRRQLQQRTCRAAADTAGARRTAGSRCPADTCSSTGARARTGAAALDGHELQSAAAASGGERLAAERHARLGNG